MVTAVGTMTDRPQTSAQLPFSGARTTGLTAGELPQQAPRPRQARRAHPLLGAFPLVVMTLATFLVLFTLMMARLRAGVDPALRTSTSTSLAATGSAPSAVTTRASGGGESAATATPAKASEESSARMPAVVTRTSGGAGPREIGDE
jgi:hypothetical protein